jgi:hypothetical protein
MPTREDSEGLPPYPQPPPGIPRMQHLQTVKASIRYWEAVRVRAIRSRDNALEWTAEGLQSSYEAALAALAKAMPPDGPKSR